MWLSLGLQGLDLKVGMAVPMCTSIIEVAKWKKDTKGGATLEERRRPLLGAVISAHRRPAPGGWKALQVRKLPWPPEAPVRRQIRVQWAQLPCGARLGCSISGVDVRESWLQRRGPVPLG